MRSGHQTERLPDSPRRLRCGRRFAQGRDGGWRWLGFAFSNVEFPEAFPIILRKQIKVGVSGDDGSAVGPVAFTRNQSGADGIGQRVEAESGKGVAPPFFLAQDVIVRLMLPFAVVAQRRFQMGAEKFHGVHLIRLAPHPHPDEVQMIRHEAVGGAEEMFPRGDVEHEFTKRGVKGGREPAPGAFFERVRPEDDGVSLVTMPFEPGQFSFLARRVHGERV